MRVLGALRPAPRGGGPLPILLTVRDVHELNEALQAAGFDLGIRLLVVPGTAVTVGRMPLAPLGRRRAARRLSGGAPGSPASGSLSVSGSPQSGT